MRIATLKSEFLMDRAQNDILRKVRKCTERKKLAGAGDL